MRVIIDRNHPLIVEDKEGVVLYSYQPLDDEEYYKKTLDELDSLAEKAIKDAKRLNKHI